MKPKIHFRWIPFGILLLSAMILGLLFLSGGLRKIVAWYLLQLALPLLGLLVLIFSIVRLIIRRRLDRVVVLSGVVSILSLLPALMLVIPTPFPASLTKTTPAVTVRLPADVFLKVVWGGDRLEQNYHVIAPDQRWAYDFVVEPYFTSSTKLEDYGCYGVSVVAPISGYVVEAQDGVPGKVSNNAKNPEGNHVAIRIEETGTYLLIAHLKPGSVRVKTGQQVAEGQEIGQCGNSGNTSEPHIHIHHQRQDPTRYPVNFAEGLPLYFKNLDGPSMPTGGVKLVDGTPVAIGATVKSK
jgi:hypothetical protein